MHTISSALTYHSYRITYTIGRTHVKFSLQDSCYMLHFRHILQQSPPEFLPLNRAFVKRLHKLIRCCREVWLSAGRSMISLVPVIDDLQQVSVF